MTPAAGTAAPRRAPERAPERGRRLRVVEAPRPRPSALAVGLGVALLLAVVFGIVAFHTLLVANQSRLDDLDRRIAAAEDRREHLELRAATLSAPDRIVQVASTDLGMVVPEEVVWLEPVPAEAAPTAPRPVEAAVDD